MVSPFMNPLLLMYYYSHQLTSFATLPINLSFLPYSPTHFLPSLPSLLTPCYSVSSGFVMYVWPLGVWEFLGSHSSAILS